MDTNKLPETITQTLYILVAPGTEKVMLHGVDMSIDGWTLLGTTTVTVDIPKVDKRTAEIEALKRKADGIRERSTEDLERIERQIKALEHDGGEG